MTGVAGCVNTLFTPPVAPVTLSGQSLYQVSTGTTIVNYTVAADGKARSNGAVLETWLGSGVSSSFELMATVTSGVLTSGTTGSWLNCGTDRTWSVNNSARNNSVVTAVITVSIRDVATQTVRATASITLSAESDNSL